MATRQVIIRAQIEFETLEQGSGPCITLIRDTGYKSGIIRATIKFEILGQGPDPYYYYLIPDTVYKSGHNDSPNKIRNFRAGPGSLFIITWIRDTGHKTGHNSNPK